MAALVYINSAEHPTLTMADYGIPPATAPPPPGPPSPPPDKGSCIAYRAWQLKTHGITFPEAELRQIYEINPDGSLGAGRTPKSIRDAIFAGRVKPGYTKI